MNNKQANYRASTTANSVAVPQSFQPIQRRRLIILLVIMELLWSLRYIASKFALREFRPLTLAAIRIVLATTLLGIVVRFSGERRNSEPIPRSAWSLFIQMGLFGIALNQLFFILGLSRTLASHSALIIATSPIVVLLIARLRGMEGLARFRILGMIISVLEVIALNLRQGFRLETQYLLGDMITSLGVLSFSYYTVMGKDVSQQFGLLRATFATYVAGMLFLIPVGVLTWNRQPWHQVTWRGLVALGYMVVFGSVVAYVIFYFALRHSDASRVASYAYLQPVMASALSIFFLGERLTLSLVTGILIILSGVFIAERGREVFDWLV